MPAFTNLQQIFGFLTQATIMKPMEDLWICLHLQTRGCVGSDPIHLHSGTYAIFRIIAIIRIILIIVSLVSCGSIATRMALAQHSSNASTSQFSIPQQRPKLTNSWIFNSICKFFVYFVISYSNVTVPFVFSRTDLSTTATKKVYLFNKRHAHMMDDIFRLMGFKNVESAEKVKFFALSDYCDYCNYSYYAIILIIPII